MDNSPIEVKPDGLDAFQKEHPLLKVLDPFEEEVAELFLIRNPQYRFAPSPAGELKEFQGRFADQKRWFYYPWLTALMSFLPEDAHLELRTARNRNLITNGEQEKMYGLKVGVAGLSVGSHAALTIAMMGAAKHMRIADPDTLSGSNLNRVRYTAASIGQKKCDLVSRWIYEVNPYADLSVYPEGIRAEEAGAFVDGLDVLVEELDNLEMKVVLRMEARKRGIPVIMITDNGDGVIADVERYDEDPTNPLFHGSLGDITPEKVRSTPPQEFPALATRVAGPELVSPRMLESVLEVGRTLYSWPQLGNAATLAGATAAYLIRKFAVGEPPRGGKYGVSFEAIFDPGAFKGESSKRGEMLKRLGLNG